MKGLNINELTAAIKDEAFPQLRFIFVLGSSRSGTSAMTMALQDLPGFGGFGEGHLWPILPIMHDTLERYRVGLEEQFLEDRNTQFFQIGVNRVLSVLISFFSCQSASISRNFVDKTPGSSMILLAPILASIFPNSRFIFMKRHPVDCINSKVRKFPGISFFSHCADWADCYSSWLKVRRDLDGRYIEIDFFDLATKVSSVASRVGDLLDLHPDDVDRLSGSLTMNRHVEATEIKTKGKLISLAASGWSLEEKTFFVEKCSIVSELFGFDLKREYLIDYDNSPSSFYYPTENTSNAFSVRANSFCYRRRYGFQVCPNGYREEDMELHFKNVGISRKILLQFDYFKEFDFGPDVDLCIKFESNIDGRLLLRRDILVKSGCRRTEILSMCDISSDCNVIFSIRLHTDQRNDYASICIENIVLK